MDTKFWGPDGWKLLHSIVSNYPPNPSKKISDIYRHFFNSIPSVLPCIYCRISFKEYMDELPIEDYLKNTQTLSNWLYKIHNKVNNKLRNQKLNDKKDPTFTEVHVRYNKYIRCINNKIESVPGFDFLYSITFNYTYTRDKMSQDRSDDYSVFFNLLPIILPFTILQKIYLQHIIDNPIHIDKQCNQSLKYWIYRLETKYRKHINEGCPCFKKTCSNIAQYKVGCKNNTCRKSTE